MPSPGIAEKTRETAPVRASARYGVVMDMLGAQSVMHSDRGIARYVVEHARAMLAFPGLVRGLMLNPAVPFPGHLPFDLLASPLLAWSTASAFRRAERAGPVAYYVIAPFEPDPPVETVVAPHALRPDVPLVVTLYDLIPLVMQDRYLSDPKVARRYHSRLDLIRSADLVLAISEHTRSDSIRLLGLDPRRVAVIGAGVSSYFVPPGPGQDPMATVRRALPRVVRPFVLSVLGDDYRKNPWGVISAYAKLPAWLRAAYQLVIACNLPSSLEDKWLRHARASGLGDDELVLTRYIPDTVLRALYQAATLFVVASLYEGFGLPVAEAIFCDCPAITSNSTSLPEIIDWAPSTFDPEDPDSIAALMERSLTDGEFLAQLREVGTARVPIHTWRAVAERTVAALETLPPPPSTRRGRPRPSHRPRIALVGPVPPARTGIADYNARVAAELSRRCELDVLSSVGASRNLAWQLPGVRRFPTAALGRTLNPSSYDAIIYTVGNSEHHHDTYEAARRHPGIVWFHDVRLGSFYQAYGSERHPGGPQELLATKLGELYGRRVPAHVVRAFDADHQSRFGLGLTTEWVRSARAVIVSSRFAEQLLRLDQGPESTMPPLWTLFHAVPEAVDVGPVKRSVPPVIASFGRVGPHKAPEALIESLVLVRKHVPARLVFVGPVQEAHSRQYLATAEQLGVGPFVEFTGDLHEPHYRRWLRRATCAAQLRRATHGESSGAVHDCLSVGLPVVTNMMSAGDEFPPDAVAPIDPALDLTQLADRLLMLLRDQEAWRRHSAAALAHAERHTFSQLADRLMGVVESLVGAGAGGNGHAGH